MTTAAAAKPHPRRTSKKNADDGVLRIETSYNDQGLVYQTTSYDAASGGSVVNQVEDIYNGLGQLTQEYQSASGAVDTGTTPSVQYGYDTPAHGANYWNPQQLAQWLRANPKLKIRSTF